jgi:hypothetical protein
LLAGEVMGSRPLRKSPPTMQEIVEGFLLTEEVLETERALGRRRSLYDLIVSYGEIDALLDLGLDSHQPASKGRTDRS